MTLYINCCVRKESRTDRIARALLDKMGGEYTEIFLPDLDLKPLSAEASDKRDRLCAACDYSDPMFDLARQFAAAERIVIAAPYWDSSFPSLLKIYLENIYVTGIVTKYLSDGSVAGLCRADELIYVTTAGGFYAPEDYGFGYVKALALSYYGIQDVRKIEADGLDIRGADVDAIMAAAEETLSGVEPL